MVRAHVQYGLPPIATSRLDPGLLDRFRLLMVHGLGLSRVMEPLAHPSVVCAADHQRPDLCSSLPGGGAAGDHTVAHTIPPGQLDLRSALPRLHNATVLVVGAQSTLLMAYVRPHAQVIIHCAPVPVPRDLHPDVSVLQECAPGAVLTQLPRLLQPERLRDIFATRLVEDSKALLCRPWTAWAAGPPGRSDARLQPQAEARFGNMMRTISTAFALASAADVGLDLGPRELRPGMRAALWFNLSDPAPGRVHYIGGCCTSCAADWVGRAQA